MHATTALLIVLIVATPPALFERAPGSGLSPALPPPGAVPAVGFAGPVPGARTVTPPAGPPTAPPVFTPPWPTFLGDAQRTSANLAERTLASGNISQMGVVWKLTFNNSIFAAPAVVNGTAYVGSWNGNEYAINTSTGHVLWQTYLGVGTCYVRGIDSSATVWNGSVYVGGGDDHWYALDARNGSIEWSVDILQYGSTMGNYDWASSLLYGGYEYIGVASCDDLPLVQGKLLQVSLSGNHSVVHEFDTVPSGEVGASIWMTPAVDPTANTVWIATGNEGGPGQPYANSIVALNASDLTLLGHWQVPSTVGLDADFVGGPILFHDAAGRPLVGAISKTGYFYALDRSNVSENGSWGPAWATYIGPSFSDPAFDGARLFASGGPVPHHPGSVLELNTKDGTPVWTSGIGDWVYATTTFAGGMVFSAADGTLQAFNASDGEPLVNFTTPNYEPIWGGIVVVGGRILFGSGNMGSSGHLWELGLPLVAPVSVAPANAAPPGVISVSSQPTGGVPPYNLTWRLARGGTTYGPSAMEFLGTAGTYSIGLSVRDASGEFTNQTVNVTLNASAPPMTANITASAVIGPAPFNVTLVAGETAGDGPPYAYSWSLGDGGPVARGAEISHVFAAPGEYLVTLQVVDPFGRQANASLTITAVVPLAVTASIGTTRGDAPLAVPYLDVTSGGAVGYSITWDFGDGSLPAHSQSGVHHFLLPGEFTVLNTVADGVGETSVHAFHVSVSAAAAPPPPFSVAGSVEIQGVDCSNNSSLVSAFAHPSGGVSPFSFTWSFDDGTPEQSGVATNHSYRAPGRYDVSLWAQSGDGSVANATTSMIVPPTGCVPHPTGPPPGTTAPTTPALATDVVVVGGILLGIAGAAVWLARRRR